MQGMCPGIAAHDSGKIAATFSECHSERILWGGSKALKIQSLQFLIPSCQFAIELQLKYSSRAIVLICFAALKSN